MAQSLPRSGRTNRRVLILIMVIGTVATLLFGIPTLFTSGYHAGREFSPDDFTVRSYEYQTIPLFNVTWSGIEYKPVVDPVCRQLLNSGLITPTGKTGDQQTWHLLWDGRFTEMPDQMRLPRDCDARLLIEYLAKTGDQGNIWTAWNLEYPKAAKVFWPVIAELARDEMYLKVPDVMEFALNLEKDDPDQFKQELNELVAEVYLELGELDLQMNQKTRAIDRLKKSIALSESDEAQQLLDSAQ
ncbi:MAG: hypothetical protein AAFN77_14075 [Planctomycetota bacterium]